MYEQPRAGCISRTGCFVLVDRHGLFRGSGQFGEGIAEAGAGIVSDLFSCRGVAELNHGLWVDGLNDGRLGVFAAADDDVAGQQCTDFRFGGEGAAGKGRVARAEDYVVPDGVRGVGAELGFKCGADVDLRQNAETLGGEGVTGAFEGLVPGQGNSCGKGVRHGAPSFLNWMTG